MSVRVRQKREDIRQEILEVARLLLEKGGMDMVTLAAVAGEMQLTKQALYHYFPSKEALVKALTASLLGDEIDHVLAELEKNTDDSQVLETMIRAFYRHYIDHLNAFRAVYCQGQLQSAARIRLDQEQIRSEVNPRTRQLFDTLEKRLSGSRVSAARRKKIRRLAFSAWLSALGLMTMRGLTEAMEDPLIHTDEELIDTLAGAFNDAAAKL